MPGPYSTPATEAAIARAIDDERGAILAEGPVLEVYFPVAGTRLDVAHRLGATPQGYVTLLEVGGSVRGIDVPQWTPELAYLVADANHTRARLFFVVTEVPINA